MSHKGQDKMRKSGEKSVKDALKQKPIPLGNPPVVKGGRKGEKAHKN